MDATQLAAAQRIVVGNASTIERTQEAVWKAPSPLLGSVSAQVVRHAHCSVVVIRHRD